MALDHYVSQVHLRNFYSPTLGGERMYAIRKRDGRKFACDSESVCRTDEGSTNSYLTEPRIVEDFLKTIEPKYNASVEKLRSGDVDHEAIYVIAGFVAYAATCSPAAMRIGKGPLRGSLEATAAILDSQGKLPPAPASLGGKSLTDLLAEGTVTFTIDEKYPQAIGISNVIGHLGNFGNFAWDILLNHEPGSPFFTSDFPVGIEDTPDPRVLNRVVPLAPDVVVRIRPELTSEGATDLKFPNFRCRRVAVRGSEVRGLNRTIVQSAENLVFFRDDAPWVSQFVDRHRRFRIEPLIDNIPTPNGQVVLSRQRLMEQEPA